MVGTISSCGRVTPQPYPQITERIDATHVAKYEYGQFFSIGLFEGKRHRHGMNETTRNGPAAKDLVCPADGNPVVIGMKDELPYPAALIQSCVEAEIAECAE